MFTYDTQIYTYVSAGQFIHINPERMMPHDLMLDSLSLMAWKLQKQARKLDRYDSYLRNLKLSILHSLTHPQGRC